MDGEGDVKASRTRILALAGWCVLVSVVSGPRSAHAEGEWAPPAGELRDVGLRVRTLGAGPPTLVLLHGLAGSNRYFGAPFDTLARNARVVAPDLLGFGDSPRPEDMDYGAEVHARAVLRALQALEIEGPLYLVGHSAGALVALRMAALAPERVRGIVAFGPPLYRSEAEAGARIQALGGMVRLFALDTVWAKLACRAMYPFPGLAGRLATRIRPDLPAPIAEDAVKHGWSSYSGTLRRLILTAQPPQELHTLPMPIRIVVGEDDEVADLGFLRELDADSEHIELEVRPGSHDLPLTDAVHSVATIRSLVGRGEAARAQASRPRRSPSHARCVDKRLRRSRRAPDRGHVAPSARATWA